LNGAKNKIKTKKGVINIVGIFTGIPLVVLTLFLATLIIAIGYYIYQVFGTGEPRPGDVSCESWSNAPEGYQDKITAAANAAGVQPSLLGAIYLSENGDAWGNRPTTATDWPNGDGPFQVIDSSGTWNEAWTAVVAAGKHMGVDVDQSHAKKNEFYINALAAAFKLKMNFSNRKIKLPTNSSDEKAVLFAGIAYNAGIRHGLEWAAAGYDVSTPPPSLGGCWGNQVGSACTYAKRTWTNFQKLNVGCAVNSPNAGQSFIQACQGGTTTSGNGNVIVIDPGHGTTTNDRSGSGEEVVNLEVAKLIRPVLEASGYTVYLTHENIDDKLPGATNEYTDNVARATFANSKNPALVLRIHADIGAADGFFMEYPQPNAPDSGKNVGPSADIAARSQDLTKKITTYLTTTANIKTTRGAVTEGEGSSLQDGKGNLIMSTHSTVPLALIEMFGMGSKNATDISYKRKLASGLANAIVASVPLSSSGQTQTVTSEMSSACKAANVALLIAKDVKDHECKDGNGCQDRQSSFVNLKAKNVKEKLSAYAYNAGKALNWGSRGVTGFTDCGRFVSYAVRTSGADPSFPEVGTWWQFKHVEDHPEKYKLMKNTKTNLQPGDILFMGHCSGSKCYYGSSEGIGHVLIYTGNNSLFPGLLYVSASLGHRGPRVNASQDPGEMGVIARMIN